MSVWEGGISGEACGCYFDCEETESGGKHAVIGLIDETAGNAELLENYVSSMVNNVCVVQMEGIEDDLIRLVCTYRSGYQQRVAVDRGTLVLRELEYRFDDTAPSSVTCLEYLDPPSFDFLDGWNGELRTVTAVWEDAMFNERGEFDPQVRTEFARIPADWEYMPYPARWDEYTVYMNEGYTKLYEYPGDGVDYTIYLTTAKG